MRRRFFTLLSAFSLLLCIASGAVWIHSLGVYDHLYGQQDIAVFSGQEMESYRGFSLVSCGGYVTAAIYIWPSPPRGLPVGRTGPWDIRWIRYDCNERFLLADARTTEHMGVVYQDGGWQRGVAIPIWLPLLASLMLPALWAVGFIKRKRRGWRGRCLACGYDLRATRDRCPECGRRQLVDPSEKSRKLPRPLTSGGAVTVLILLMVASLWWFLRDTPERALQDIQLAVAAGDIPRFHSRLSQFTQGRLGEYAIGDLASQEAALMHAMALQAPLKAKSREILRDGTRLSVVGNSPYWPNEEGMWFIREDGRWKYAIDKGTFWFYAVREIELQQRRKQAPREARATQAQLVELPDEAKSGTKWRESAAESARMRASADAAARYRVIVGMTEEQMLDSLYRLEFRVRSNIEKCQAEGRLVTFTLYTAEKANPFTRVQPFGSYAVIRVKDGIVIEVKSNGAQDAVPFKTKL